MAFANQGMLHLWLPWPKHCHHAANCSSCCVHSFFLDKPSSPSPHPSPSSSPSPSPQPSPSPSPRPEPPQPNGTSMGMIVGIVAGLGLGLAALRVGIFFLMKHKRSSKAQSSSQPSGHKAAGQVAHVKADVEMGGADQMGGTPRKIALVK